jgi:Omp85 superfamily domain
MSENSNRRKNEARNKLMAEQLSKFFMNFKIHLAFPWIKTTTKTGDRPRTNSDILLLRLQESGILLDDEEQTIEECTIAASQFIKSMNQSGCFNGVQVKIEEHEDPGKSRLHVLLDEKKWYQLYVGGGLKNDGMNSSNNFLPKVQFETTGSLLNLTGFLDKTRISYAVDQASETTLTMSHERPLISCLPEFFPVYDALFQMVDGSEYHMVARAAFDTIDHEWSRSYKEYQRLVSLRLANRSAKIPEMTEGGYFGLDWTFVFRDIIPRRHIKLPYHCDASHEIVSQSGPTAKNSLTWEYHTNGKYMDSQFDPTTGTDINAKLELAGPPGDVGFLKAEGRVSSHIPIVHNGLSLHTSVSSGVLHAISFGDMCGPPTISDRFFVGGPLELRGFLPSGIGPRASTPGGSSVPGGDALGGNFFYTATLAASVPAPDLFHLGINMRLFGFANAGTLLTGLPSISEVSHLHSIFRSTRVAVGGGLAAETPFGRAELTYALPLRYGPRDSRKSVQLGFGLNFG